MSKKRPMKVLSIDFDYFQDVTPEVLINCYPDGKDLPTALTMMTWTSHYAHSYDELMSVKIDEKHLSQICKIIGNQDIATPNMAVQSHIHIYDFIKEHFDKTKYNGCQIVNIDMHHDCFNDNTELDCGNWVNHIKKDIPNCEVMWIANKVSNDVYGLEKLSHLIQYDFDKILNTKFDLIFICRSDTWLPPHLDPYFDKLYQILRRNFLTTIIDSQIEKPRNFEEIKENAESYKQQMAEFTASLKDIKKGE